MAVWTLLRIAVYALYRRRGSLAASAAASAAGVYELMPLRQRFRPRCRRRCRESVGSGLRFGFHCPGSSIGLMLMLALGVMSVSRMSVNAVRVLAPKLLSPEAAIHVPRARAMVRLGFLTVLVPSAVSRTHATAARRPRSHRPSRCDDTKERNDDQSQDRGQRL